MTALYNDPPIGVSKASLKTRPQSKYAYERCGHSKRSKVEVVAASAPIKPKTAPMAL